ncbi:MAG: hypothetical protein ACE5OP_06725 [Candidatus Glassbacteria bacterium]
MKRAKNIITILVISCLMPTFTPGCGATYVDHGPPPPPVEELRPAPPSPHSVWIAGHWTWNSARDSYEWVPGHWAKPRPGKVWVSGHWKRTPRGWVWVKGHWR